MYFPQIGKAHCPDYRQRQRLPVVKVKMAIALAEFKPNRRHTPHFHWLAKRLPSCLNRAKL